jgi:xanthine dehydrogenase accessory factor
MTEIVSICRAWQELSHMGEQAFLATVVRSEGSTYRRPGARLLFTRESVIAGAVSGGCLERDLVLRGPWLAQHGPWLERIDTQADDDDRPGSGCNGTLDVLIEPLSDASDSALGIIGRELEAERRVSLATVLPGAHGGVRLGARVVKTARGLASELPDADFAHSLHRAVRAAHCVSSFQATHFRHPHATALVELLEPPPHLFVFGAGPDVVPVARFAQELGWNVTVCAPPGRPTLRERFAGLARLSEAPLERLLANLGACARPLALVMSHDYERDRDAIAGLLGSNARYVGVLGPAARTERLLVAIETARGPIPATRRAALAAPAGLALGAETPAEIALSIVAEAQAALTQSTKTPLRTSAGPIHPRVTAPAVIAHSNVA